MVETVSFVIPTYNGGDTIESCLQSVGEQDWPEIEIIVVDDNSEENIKKIIDSEELSVRYIQLAKNRGHTGASNAGFRQASGKYIVMLDDDAELPRCWTEKLLSVIERDDQIAVVQPRIEEPENVRNETGPITTFQACGVMCLREAIKSVDYYDERYFVYYDDYQLAAALLNKGYRIVGTDKTTTYHKESKSGRLSDFQTYYETRNMLWYYWQYYRYKPAAVHTAGWIVRRARKSVRDGTVIAYIRGVLSSFRGFDYLFAKHNPCEQLEANKN